MNDSSRRLRALCLAAVAALAFQSSVAVALKIGVVPGAYSDSAQAAAKEAKKRGIEVQVTAFTDWTTLNVPRAALGLPPYPAAAWRRPAKVGG